MGFVSPQRIGQTPGRTDTYAIQKQFRFTSDLTLRFLHTGDETFRMMHLVEIIGLEPMSAPEQSRFKMKVSYPLLSDTFTVVIFEAYL